MVVQVMHVDAPCVMGSVSTLGVGVRLSASPLPRDSDTHSNPTREKRDHIHHTTHTESAQHHSANTRPRSLLGS